MNIKNDQYSTISTTNQSLNRVPSPANPLLEERNDTRIGKVSDQGLVRSTLTHKFARACDTKEIVMIILIGVLIAALVVTFGVVVIVVKRVVVIIAVVIVVITVERD